MHIQLQIGTMKHFYQNIYSRVAKWHIHYIQLNFKRRTETRLALKNKCNMSNSWKRENQAKGVAWLRVKDKKN